MKNFAVLFILALVAVTYKTELSAYIQAEKRRYEIRQVISSLPLFYSPQVIKSLKIDSFFLLEKLIAKTKDEKISLDGARYKNDPFIRLLSKDIFITDLTFTRTENDSYVINPQYSLYLADPWDSVLLKALYCDKSTYTKEDFLLLEKLHHRDGGYFDTHFLIGLLFLKENNCYEEGAIKKSISDVAKVIVNAANSDTIFSDLYAERIVVLYWAGYGKDVKDSWIDVVRSAYNERRSGWTTNSSSTYFNPHSTGLAFLSLVYYLERRESQVFYK